MNFGLCSTLAWYQVGQGTADFSDTSAQSGILTRTNAVSAGSLVFTIDVDEEPEDDLDLVNSAGDAKYYVGTGTATVDVANPNKYGNFTVTVTVEASTGAEATLKQLINDYFTTQAKHMYATATIASQAANGLQVKTVANATAAPSSYAATNGAGSAGDKRVEITQSGLGYSELADDATSATQTFYVAYWLLEDGTHQDPASAVGGTITFGFVDSIN